MATTLPTRTADSLGDACVVLAGASILGSIATWASARGDTPEETAHAERFGIFIGLWAPTFLILGNYFRNTAAARLPAGASDGGSEATVG